LPYTDRKEGEINKYIGKPISPWIGDAITLTAAVRVTTGELQ